MYPQLPPEPFLDLAREQLGLNQKKRGTNPDGFVSTVDALEPDPLFMGLRRIATTGPIGALVHRVSRWIEAREDRRHGQTIDDALQLGTPDRLAQTADNGVSGTDRDDRIAA